MGGLRGPPSGSRILGGDWEALEGLRLGVGSLEGSLGLLSWDFHPRTGMNPSSSVEGVTEGVEVEAVPCCRGRGNSLLGVPVDAHSSSAQTCSSQETCLWLRGASPPP